MGIKEFFSRAGRFMHISGKEEKARSQEQEFVQSASLQQRSSTQEKEQASLARLEKIEEGFTNMVDHLEGINTNLKNLPEFVDNQKELTGQLINHIHSTSEKDERLIEMIKQLPKETAKANRRNIWIFSIIIGICLMIIFVLFGLIFYYK